MKKRVVIAMIASMAFAVTAWGAETEYSGTLCGISKRNVLYSTSDLTVLSLETWGIQPSESTFEPWKNASVHCVGYGRITQGKLSSTGSCLWTDPTGDIFIGEFQAVPDKPGIWTFLSGTGKWQGIKGGGEFHPVSRGKTFPTEPSLSAMATPASTHCRKCRPRGIGAVARSLAALIGVVSAGSRSCYAPTT